MTTQKHTPLTRRQQDFLSRFLDLYKEAQGPLHYTEVARRLGIGKVTAYEMLRLLEERGLARSEFRLPKGKRGPGRATVVFAPTEAAHSLMRQLTDEAASEDWEAIKSQILERLRRGQTEGYDELLNDLLARLPERHSNPLRYCAEVITAVLLTLRTLLEGAYGQKLRERLSRIGLPGELGLSALTGLAMAVGLAERVNRRVSTKLLREANRYQNNLQKLSAENRRCLADFVREVISIISAGHHTPPLNHKGKPINGNK